MFRDRCTRCGCVHYNGYTKCVGCGLPYDGVPENGRCVCGVARMNGYTRCPGCGAAYDMGESE